MDYVAKGGELCQSIAKQPKPEGMSDDNFAEKVSQDKASVQSSCEFLETMGVNVISSETDAKARMADIDQFTNGFPD